MLNAKRLSHHLSKAIAMDNVILGLSWLAKTLLCNYVKSLSVYDQEMNCPGAKDKMNFNKKNTFT